MSLPVLTVTALVDTYRVACAAAPDAREAAAVRALAARLPAVAGLARQLVKAGRGESTAQLRND